MRFLSYLSTGPPVQQGGACFGSVVFLYSINIQYQIGLESPLMDLSVCLPDSMIHCIHFRHEASIGVVFKKHFM